MKEERTLLQLAREETHIQRLTVLERAQFERRHDLNCTAGLRSQENTDAYSIGGWWQSDFHRCHQGSIQESAVFPSASVLHRSRVK